MADSGAGSSSLEDKIVERLTKVIQEQFAAERKILLDELAKVRQELAASSGPKRASAKRSSKSASGSSSNPFAAIDNATNVSAGFKHEKIEKIQSVVQEPATSTGTPPVVSLTAAETNKLFKGGTVDPKLLEIANSYERQENNDTSKKVPESASKDDASVRNDDVARRPKRRQHSLLIDSQDSNKKRRIDNVDRNHSDANDRRKSDGQHNNKGRGKGKGKGKGKKQSKFFDSKFTDQATEFTTNSTIPCRDFVMGKCPHERCPKGYSHDPKICNDQSRRDPCMFFAQGRCDKGERCPFAHDLKLFACRDFVAGTCTRGASCNFNHAIPTVEKDKQRFVRLNKEWLLTPESANGPNDSVRKRWKPYIPNSSKFMKPDGSLLKADGYRKKDATTIAIEKEAAPNPTAESILAEIDPLLAAPLAAIPTPLSKASESAKQKASVPTISTTKAEASSHDAASESVGQSSTDDHSKPSNTSLPPPLLITSSLEDDDDFEFQDD